ncbi:MAG: D-2-hydroxyacid dehydrogenase [Saprospiraceae bacterium]|nr:D-2-hydroxyacid dehydrogenase [Saprospiraceae bacterium]
MAQALQIAILDGFTLNPGDLDWKALDSLGEIQIHDHSASDLLLERAKGKGVLVVNKAPIGRALMEQLTELKLITLTATGYNNIDVEAAKELGITVCNVRGYGSHTVAQHVFALLLSFTNQVWQHHQSVQEGDWSSQDNFCYTLETLYELQGKTMGIYGLGKIGQSVAQIAQAFGMQVLSHHKHPERDARPGVEFVGVEELFMRSDFVTLHAPLSNQNAGFVNSSLLKKMKPSAILINTGRGGLINEADLKTALQEGTIRGAALDVLSSEPPPKDHPLFGLHNCIITPHIAWASQAARKRLISETKANIEAFFAGEARNVVV